MYKTPRVYPPPKWYVLCRMGRSTLLTRSRTSDWIFSDSKHLRCWDGVVVTDAVGGVAIATAASGFVSATGEGDSGRLAGAGLCPSC